MEEKRIKRIEYSKKFLKSLEKLPKTVADEAEKKEKIFKENPFHPVLRTHKLHGKDRMSWAFWTTRSHRIKFIFLGDKEVLFLDIGGHDIYS